MAVSRRLILVVALSAFVPALYGAEVNYASPIPIVIKDATFPINSVALGDGDIDGGCRGRWPGLGSEGSEIHSLAGRTFRPRRPAMAIRTGPAQWSSSPFHSQH